MKTSLIYTVYNRGMQLMRSIERMLTLTLPDEVIIVDDGSTDGTQNMITCLFENLKKNPPCDNLPTITSCYLRRQEYSGACKAKNVGLKKATGDYLIFSEGEMVFISDVIAQMKEMIANNENLCYTAGSVYVMGEKVQRGLPSRWWRTPEIIPFHNYVKKMVAGVKYGPLDIVLWYKLIAPYILGIKKEHLMRLNGWREDFKGWGFDDHDILTRLRVSGINQKIPEEVSAIHQYHIRPSKGPADGWMQNEKLFLDANYDNNHDRLIANQDISWGEII